MNARTNVACILMVLSFLLAPGHAGRAEDRERGKLLTGQGASGDWRQDAPGVRRLIRAADLPPPNATRSVDRGPRIVRRPEKAWPQAPDGFRVDLVATDLNNPRAENALPGSHTRAPRRRTRLRSAPPPSYTRSAMTHEMTTRAATGDHAEALARIYNEEIQDRTATFETRTRTAEEVRAWVGGSHPVVVVEEQGMVIAWASSFAYSPRPCYAGVVEISVYVARDARRKGAGTRALDGLVRATAAAGFHKLVGKILAGNEASLALVKALGFREVGVHLRHGQLDGIWHDVVVVERLLHA
jgi:L-amino acid N-acyltransferase YncA